MFFCFATKYFKIEYLILLCNISANSLTTLFTNPLKRDIMHSAKLKTMCSADKDFAMQIYQKGLCGKAFGL